MVAVGFCWLTFELQSEVQVRFLVLLTQMCGNIIVAEPLELLKLKKKKMLKVKKMKTEKGLDESKKLCQVCCSVVSLK